MSMVPYFPNTGEPYNGFGHIIGGVASQAELSGGYAQWCDRVKITDLDEERREKFLASCSQGWLNAMLDVELGII